MYLESPNQGKKSLPLSLIMAATTLLTQTNSAAAAPAPSSSPKDKIVTSKVDVISNKPGSSKGPTTSKLQDQLITLNNKGVRAMNASDNWLAMEFLEKALTLDPSYKTARINLAIAYNNSGLTLRDRPAEAIAYFHYAVYIAPDNLACKDNLKAIILKLGKDPDVFEDRVALGNEALRKDDTRGGIVEYEAALKIKEDSAVRAKLSAAVAALKKSGKQNL
jgi:tetratricopeptide (TPR) repeat protein